MIHEFNPVIYPYKLWVIIDKTPGIVADNFNEYTGKPIEFIERDTRMLGAFTMQVAKKEPASYGVVIFFRSKKSMTYELVAHESSHAAKSGGEAIINPFSGLVLLGCCVFMYIWFCVLCDLVFTIIH